MEYNAPIATLNLVSGMDRRYGGHAWTFTKTWRWLLRIHEFVRQLQELLAHLIEEELGRPKDSLRHAPMHLLGRHHSRFREQQSARKRDEYGARNKCRVRDDIDFTTEMIFPINPYTQPVINHHTHRLTGEKDHHHQGEECQPTRI